MAEALFAAPGCRAFEIGEDDLPALQRFFEENPAYFEIVGGEGPASDAAAAEFADRPPPGWPWDGKWMIRFEDDAGAWAGVADVVRNLLAEGVWHVGLFIAATRLHGSGAAAGMYAALEAWARAGGARWMRLNVAAGNPRAGRFWERMGFTEVRRREGVEVGRLVNTMRVMVKPLAGDSLEAHLALVPRDRPGAP